MLHYSARRQAIHQPSQLALGCALSFSQLDLVDFWATGDTVVASKSANINSQQIGQIQIPPLFTSAIDDDNGYGDVFACSRNVRCVCLGPLKMHLCTSGTGLFRINSGLIHEGLFPSR